MSVEEAIDSFIGDLKAISADYRGQAVSLVRAADDRLLSLKTPKAKDIEYDVNRDAPDFTRIPRPPTQKEIRPLKLPEIGELQDILQINNSFTASAPDLIIPGLRSDPPTGPDFFGNVPSLPVAELRPKAPALESPDLPDQAAPTTITVDPLTGEPPNVPQPVFTEFTGDFLAEYETGLNLMSSGLTEWTAWLNGLRDQLLPIEGLLITRLRGVLTGKEPGLTDAWETQTFQQGQQATYNERYTELDNLDALPSSIAGLPMGSRTYTRLRLELQALQAVMENAAKTANERQQREVQHLQWALELCLKMADAAIQIKAQEATWRMKGVMLALEGAEATLDVALKVLAFKEKELAFITRYNETQVRRTEDLMKIEKTKLEVLQVEVANNKLKTTYNDHQAEIYRIAGQWIETTIRLYQTQVDYLKVDIGWRKLALQGFEMDVAAFQTKIKGAEADQAAQQAAIKNDLTRAEAEMAKVRIYEAELSAVIADVQANAATVKAQAQQNANRLAEYNATVSAQLQYLQLLERSVNTSLDALIKGFSAEVAEQKLAIARQDILDQTALNEAMNLMRTDQLALSKTLKAHQITLSQLTAQASVMDSGAGTLGSIAQSAFSGLNAVASTDIVESA